MYAHKIGSSLTHFWNKDKSQKDCTEGEKSNTVDGSTDLNPGFKHKWEYNGYHSNRYCYVYNCRDPLSIVEYFYLDFPSSKGKDQSQYENNQYTEVVDD